MYFSLSLCSTIMTCVHSISVKMITMCMVCGGLHHKWVSSLVLWVGVGGECVWGGECVCVVIVGVW